MGRTTVPPDVFSRDLHQPSVKIDDSPEPEVPSAQSEAPSARPEVPSVQPEAPSASEGEALHVEEERSEVMPDRNWQTPYLQYLRQGELPLDRAEARRVARRAKSFVLLGDEKELYHRSPSGILQRCISIAEGQELLQEIHSGACGHHAAHRALVGNAFRQGYTVFPDFFRKILKSGENRRIKGDKCTADYIDSYRFSFIVILCRFLMHTNIRNHQSFRGTTISVYC